MADTKVAHGAMPLPPGTEAPDFELHSTPDQTVSLAEFRRQPLILAFYLEDWSPVCSDQLALYQQVLPEFKEFNAELLGIVDGQGHVIQRSLVLWDPEGILARIRIEIAAHLSEIAPALLSERLERARYDIENHIPRALAGQDYIWAEECRRSALNEIIRAVFYMNGLFLMRLKGVPTEAEKLAIRPEGYSEKLKLIATSPVATALPHLSALFGEVAALSEIGPMSPGVGY